MNTTINSLPSALTQTFGYAMQAVYTGVPTGIIKLQASCDPFKYLVDGGLQTPTNWDDITNSQFTLSDQGVTIWNVTGVFYQFVRVVYEDTSGGTSTAVLNVTISTKG